MLLAAPEISSDVTSVIEVCGSMSSTDRARDSTRGGVRLGTNIEQNASLGNIEMHFEHVGIKILTPEIFANLIMNFVITMP